MLSAQAKAESAGGRLVPEEAAKRDRHPLDRWDEIADRAAHSQFPKGLDVFFTKYQGLFYVAPAQESFMCRLRLPGGVLPSHQARALADLARKRAGGYVDVTTRANLQLREIGSADGPLLLEELQELGIVARGSGADNVRNVVGSATAGFDQDELVDTRPFSRAVHFAILQRRDLYGLPRKFNIAFDGGGRIRSLEDTNDVGFTAVRVVSGPAPPGVYFRAALGGVTGHKAFASDLGVLVAPEDAVAAAVAAVRLFLDEGDRTDRKKARFKYVVDRLGLARCRAELERRLGKALLSADGNSFAPQPPCNPMAHVGVHQQKQPGKNYLGVVTAVGRLTSDQLRGLADLADDFGSAELRLTVWQNVLIPGIDDCRIAAARDRLKSLGLDCEAGPVRAGVVACTGNRGCKYAAADTKGHALAIADHLDREVPLDVAFNLHVTGCHHSCAQHFVGDVGLLATKVEVDGEEVEGFRLFLGGTAGGRTGSQAFLAEGAGPPIPASTLPLALERVFKKYMTGRMGPEEGFGEYCRRAGAEAVAEEAAL